MNVDAQWWKKRVLSWHLASEDIKPGMPAYFSRAKNFMPLAVHLGYTAGDFDRVDWKPGKCGNGSMLILGSSGSGKTETLKRIGLGIIQHAIPLLILDFHGDVIFPGMETVLMSSGIASKIGVNPLELTVHDPDRVGLIDQRMAFSGILKRAIPTLSLNQQAIMTAALGMAYRRVGIFDDMPETCCNPAPTMAMVIGILQEWLSDDLQPYSATSIRGCMNAISAVFGHPVFNRDCSLNISHVVASNIRIDLSMVDDSVRFIAAEVLLRMVFSYLRGMGPIPVQPSDDTERFRLFVLVDEAKILAMGKGDPDGRDRILNVLATEGRKFGIGLILASQMSDHFGIDAMSNIATRLVLKPLDAREAKRNASNVQVSSDELLGLNGYGEGFYKTGSRERAVKIQVQELPGASSPKFGSGV